MGRIMDFLLMSLGVSSGKLVEEDKWSEYREQEQEKMRAARDHEQPDAPGADPPGGRDDASG